MGPPLTRNGPVAWLLIIPSLVPKHTMATDTPARNLRQRRSKPDMYGDWVGTPSKTALGHNNANNTGKANGVANGTQLVEPSAKAKTQAKKADGGITDHGRETDRRLDTHES